MQTRWLVPSIILALLWIAGAGRGWAQPTPEGPLPFDPHHVIIVEGVVVALPEVKPQALPEMVQLMLKTTRGENLRVILGPNWFLARQPWRIALLDRLEVKGSPFRLGGQAALVVQELKRGESVMKFRDDRGVPLWAGPRKER